MTLLESQFLENYGSREERLDTNICSSTEANSLWDIKTAKFYLSQTLQYNQHCEGIFHIDFLEFYFSVLIKLIFFQYLIPQSFIVFMRENKT